MKKHVLVSALATVIFPLIFFAYIALNNNGMIDGRPDNAPMRGAVGMILILPFVFVLQAFLLWGLGRAQNNAKQPSVKLALIYPTILAVPLPSFMLWEQPEFYLSAVVTYLFLWVSIFFGSYLQYFLISKNTEKVL